MTASKKRATRAKKKEATVRRAPAAAKAKPGARTWVDELRAVAARIPDEDLAFLPTDLAQNLDDYMLQAVTPPRRPRASGVAHPGPCYDQAMTTAKRPTARAVKKTAAPRRAAAKKAAPVTKKAAPTKRRRTFWDDLAEIGARVPPDQRLPPDAATNFDDYLLDAISNGR